jgi:hypothetical protein
MTLKLFSTTVPILVIFWTTSRRTFGHPVRLIVDCFAAGKKARYETVEIGRSLRGKRLATQNLAVVSIVNGRVILGTFPNVFGQVALVGSFSVAFAHVVLVLD